MLLRSQRRRRRWLGGEEEEQVAATKPKRTKKRARASSLSATVTLPEIADHLRRFFHSANLVVRYDDTHKVVTATTCLSGCHCLVLTMLKKPFATLNLGSLRYPAPSNCALSGNELMAGVLDCANTFSIPVRLVDSALKKTARHTYMKVAVVSILRTGLSWYERFGFVSMHPFKQSYRELNEEFRTMALRTLVSMNLLDFWTARQEEDVTTSSSSSFDRVANQVQGAKNRISESRMDFRVCEFFTNEFFEKAAQNDAIGREQLLVYELSLLFVIYPRTLIYRPK